MNTTPAESIVGHTPGPWHQANGTIYWTAPGTNNDWIVAQVVEPPVRPSEEAVANARLIAASPRLLHAVRLAELHLGVFSDDKCFDAGPSGNRCTECVGCSVHMVRTAIREALADAGSGPL